MARLRLMGGEGATPDDVVTGERAGPDWGGLVDGGADLAGGQEGMDSLKDFTPDVHLRDSGRVGGEELPEKDPDGWDNQGRGQETSRERSQATPKMSSTPTPQAGAQQQLGAGTSGGSVGMRSPQGVLPFTPMGSPVIDGGQMGGRGIYGSMGGLQGGGFGQANDMTSGVESDPISSLLQMLMSRR